MGRIEMLILLLRKKRFKILFDWFCDMSFIFYELQIDMLISTYI